MPTTDISEATRPFVSAQRVGAIFDLDGYLARMMHRPTDATIDTDGVWSQDAHIPAPLQRSLGRLADKMFVIALTGGTAMRGRRLVSSAVKANADKILVAGTDGAQVLRPGSNKAEIYEKYHADAAKVSRFVDQITPVAQELGVQIERKGDRNMTVSVSFHFSNLSADRQAEVITRFTPFAQRAEADGLSQLLDTGNNKNLTISSKGLSKEPGIVDVVTLVEQERDVRFDGLIFGGDGSTDENAFKGMHRLREAFESRGRQLATLNVAAMSNWNLSSSLVKASDLVVRGSDLTTEEARAVADSSDCKFDFDASGFNPEDLRSIGELMSVMERDFVCSLPPGLAYPVTQTLR